MIAAFLMMSAVADPSVLIARASHRLSARPWSLSRGDAAPRIARDHALPVSMKDRALSEDGQRCSLVGGRVCTNPPRTWVTAGF